MTKYLTYGAEIDAKFAYAMEGDPVPNATISSTEKEAITRISRKIYRLFKETLRACGVDIPSDQEALKNFLLGKSPDNDHRFINIRDFRTVRYDDRPFLEKYHIPGRVRYGSTLNLRILKNPGT